MYLTYAEYQEYGGTLDETAFNDIEFEAESYIDWYTFNRLWNETEYPERLKRCMNQIIKLIVLRMKLIGEPVTAEQEEGTSDSAQIASMSNDGVSIHYNIVSAKDALETSKKEINRIIEQQLAGVTNSLGRRLLYRGLYPGE